MAYSSSLLPKSAAYYSLSRASIANDQLTIEAGGYAEINVTQQMLPTLTSKMLVVVHPSIFSDAYTSTAVQVDISVITSSGEYLKYCITASEQSSGVFNTEIELPEGEDYVLFTYRISSAVTTTVYNWELCAEEASDITAVINGVEQTIPKLLYDYNTYAYAVGQDEVTVGLITCYLKSATDLNGHFTFSFFATERCNVHVRVKDNGVTELFSPQVYTVEAGYASVSIPHAYLKKLATTHSFSISVQCTNGQLSVPVRGVLYTIDGGYLATRLLDPGIDVLDISIRQTSSDLEPSEIHAIGFEGNRVILKSLEYNPSSQANWSVVHDFGEAITACVEFYGRWTSRNNAVKNTIETEEVPWVFIVDTSGNLVVYTGNSFDTTFTIDTGVSWASACLGFNSMHYLEQDQGMIVAYLKNGNVYYRQYVYNANTETYVWYTIAELYTAGDASFVSVHRLPDYRVGFCVTHGSETTWYISDRTYVAQSYKPEIIEAETGSHNITTVIDVARVGEATGVATQNAFEEGLYFNGFVMTFDGTLVFTNGTSFSDLQDSLVVTVEGTEVAVSSIVIEDNVITITLVSDVRGGNDVVISYNHPFLVETIYNGCLCNITQTYTWSLPLPTRRESYSESASLGVSTTMTITPRPIITTQLDEQIEVSNVSVAPLLTVTPLLIVTTEQQAPNESISAAVSVTLSVTPIQVGVTPV